ncbi:hypothetical protein SDC9_122405 [bioreactor metagenome]|uniref:Secretion system C-terminal sorting domain-containing protein n=1 Tax=bioreactor metagenome TaxID=1076179 RepID=A0A645CEY3_9ZZZZ
MRFVCNANTDAAGLSVLIDDIKILNTNNPNDVKDNTPTVCDLNITPNPANKEVTLSFPKALYNPEIQVVNVLGTEIFNLKLIGEFNHTPLNIENLDNGVYFIRVNSENTVFQSRLNVIR